MNKNRIYKDMGGLVGGQTKLDMNKDGMITGQDFKMMPKKYGGKIKNRNMGGVIGGGLASQDVTDYLYKYDS